jgi:hypothetical protein
MPAILKAHHQRLFVTELSFAAQAIRKPIIEIICRHAKSDFDALMTAQGKVESIWGGQHVYLRVNGAEVKGSFEDLISLLGERIDVT